MTTNPQTAMNLYLDQCQAQYQAEVKQIAIFNSVITAKWDLETKLKFTKIFYHIRGHFIDMLWHLGNLAPNIEYKSIVLKNIQEEFGSKNSHEVLFFNFANSLGADIKNEIVRPVWYLDFVKEFNHNHIKFVLEKSWNSAWAAFSAYEKLDNLDYPNLFELAQSLDVNRQALVFFKIHMSVTHFDNTEPKLIQIWESDPESVKAGFEFIFKNQLEMWRSLDAEMHNQK